MKDPYKSVRRETPPPDFKFGVDKKSKKKKRRKKNKDIIEVELKEMELYKEDEELDKIAEENTRRYFEEKFI